MCLFVETSQILFWTLKKILALETLSRKGCWFLQVLVQVVVKVVPNYVFARTVCTASTSLTIGARIWMNTSERTALGYCVVRGFVPRVSGSNASCKQTLDRT